MLIHSDSVKFMRQMIQNESFNNLMEILEVEEMNNMFQGCINEDDDDEDHSP